MLRTRHSGVIARGQFRMAIFKLNRVDKPHHGETWQIEIGANTARLIQPDGHTAATFTADQAHDAVELVHFAKSGHNIAINVGDTTVHFAAWPKAFKSIKAFTEQSSHAGSPKKLQQLRRAGLIRLVVGGLLFFGGGILSIDAFLKLGGLGGGGESYLFYGAIVIGAAFLYQSYYYYAEARRLGKPRAA